MAFTLQSSSTPTTSPRAASRWRVGGRALDLVALAFLGVVAAAFRLYRLDNLPPGLHHDEAVNGLDVLITIPRLHPIFFELNNGREPLFIYLEWVSVHLFGASPWSLRVTAATVGIVTVLAVYLLARAWYGRAVGLVAAFALATSFWHVDLSRIGLRSIAAPLFLTLALYFLYRGVRDRSLLGCALAGAFLALDLYTYSSARVAVVLVVAIFGWETLRAPRFWKRRFVELATVTVVALIVFAPLGAYFLSHPDSLIHRADEVWIFNPNPQIEGQKVGLAENVRNTLGLFVVRGDVNPRQNVPGRPVFDLPAAPWFLLGLALLVGQALRGKDLTPGHPFQGPPSRRGKGAPNLEAPAQGVASLMTQSVEPDQSPATPPSLTGKGDPGKGAPGLGPTPAAWVLLWMLGMLALGALTYESPDFLRLSSLAPPTFITFAVGLVAAARWFSRRFGDRGGNVSGLIEDGPTAWMARWSAARRAGPGLVASALVVGLLGYEAAHTGQLYFGAWAGRADVYEGFDGGLTAAARYVENAVPSTRALAFYVDRSPDILFNSPRSRVGRWLQEYSDVLLLPRDPSGGATFVFAGDGSVSHSPDRYFHDLTPAARDIDSAGNVGFVGYDLTSEQLGKLETPAVVKNARFGGSAGPVELVGYTLDQPEARPGESVGLSVLWRVHRDADTAYAPYLHVVDDAGNPWGQDDLVGYAVNGWKDGDLFLSRFAWKVPVGTPPARYHFAVGIATRAVGFPPGPPQSIGDPLDLGAVSISGWSVLPPGATPPAPQRLIGATLGGLTLVGTSDLPTSVKPGDTPRVELLWQAKAALATDPRVDLTLDNGTSLGVVVASGRPGGDALPTNRWPAGAVLRDLRTLVISAAAPSGAVHLVAVGYDATSGREVGRIDLGTTTVVAPPRDFALPHPQHPLNQRFDDGITLLGYDLSAPSLEPGGTLRVTLYWQDQKTPARDYTGFVHLLDPQNHVVAQHDGQPADGQLPTLGWVPGQVVVDAYDLALKGDAPAPTLTLEVGMYDPTTGARLAVGNGDPDHRVVLGTIPVGKAS